MPLHVIVVRTASARRAAPKIFRGRFTPRVTSTPTTKKHNEPPAHWMKRSPILDPPKSLGDWRKLLPGASQGASSLVREAQRQSAFYYGKPGDAMPTLGVILSPFCTLEAAKCIAESVTSRLENV